MAIAHNGSYVDHGYRSPIDEAKAKVARKAEAIQDLSGSNAKDLIDSTRLYGKEFASFDHMHNKDEFRRDKLAYEAAYRDVCTFYHPDLNQRIVLTLNEAVGLSADVELIRNAAIEWVKAQ